jgi:hypothetical protein
VKASPECGKDLRRYRTGAPVRVGTGADILTIVTSTAVRRLLAAAALAGLAVATILATAAPASADTPEGWPEEESVDFLNAVLYLGGVPVLIFIAVVALIYGPALARGESIKPGGQPLESQWLGGPRKSAGELAAPDSEDSKAGGAGGTW